MMKPGKTFKMRSTTKTMLATIVDPQMRSAWKRAMIEAQLCSEVVVKSAPRDKNAPREQRSNYQVNDTGTASTAV
jgi:hypothetical protein